MMHRSLLILVAAVSSSCTVGEVTGSAAPSLGSSSADAGWRRPFLQPWGTVALSFTVDDRANRTYAAGELSWRGSFTYNAATRRLTYDPTWGDRVPLYDDGSYLTGGHEPPGEVAGDHRFGVTAFLAVPSAARVLEYGAVNADGGWIWLGPNGRITVPAASTKAIVVPGLNVPAFGSVDLELSLDTTALAPPFSAPASATIKGTFSAWREVPAISRGTRRVFTLSEHVGPGGDLPHAGLLAPGNTIEFVWVLDGAEYRGPIPAGVQGALTAGARAAARSTPGSSLSTLPIVRAANTNTEVTITAPAVDYRDEVLYMAMTDRFASGDPTNDAADGTRSRDAADPADPWAWHGGDFRGITKRIAGGYFSRMGFTTLWISAVQRQSDGGYHGYWVDDYFQIEPHFGTLADLQELVKTAHAWGLKVVLDQLMNHAGYGSHLVTDHPDWFRTGSACGTDEITTCIYGLPDFVQEVPEARQYLVDSVQRLVDDTGIDGFRLDATRHVPDWFWADFLAAGAVGDRSKTWSLGEVWDTRASRLAHYVDDVGMSVFDFGFYQAVGDALASGKTSHALVAHLADDVAFRDPTLLATFIDNHDVTRFVSAAQNAGATREQALERLDAALTLLYATRGIPVVYYGTEIGAEGPADPWNRADMDFSALDSSTTDERLALLATARSSEPALRRGVETALWPPLDACPSYPDVGLDPGEALGAPLFLRGDFDQWGEPGPSRALVNTGANVYRARFALPPGRWEWKIADAAWTIERTPDPASPVPLDTWVPTQDRGDWSPNALVDVLAGGACVSWTLDTTDATVPLLSVTEEPLGPDVFVFSRSLDGSRSIVGVVNPTDADVDLEIAPGGGIRVSGLLGDGAPIELTGRPHGLQVRGGLLVGRIRPRTSLLLRN